MWFKFLGCEATEDERSLDLSAGVSKELEDTPESLFGSFLVRCWI